MHNNKFPHQLSESLDYKDMEGLLKPTIHVDEFSSKMGDDDDIIVISFFVRDQQAAKDLMNWFEKGYDFVIDADRSPGEIKPNRYLVYVELRRRSTAGSQIEQLITDLGTLTEFEDASDWTMHYDGQEVPFSEQAFVDMVPLSPRAYRERKESRLNEMRVAAGLPTQPIYDKNDPDLRRLRSAAGF